MNKLLARQIKKRFGSLENIPDELKEIIGDINNTYENFEDDITLLQNSIEISSQELRNAYQKHKEDALVQKETIEKIKEVIYAIKPTTDIDRSENVPTAAESAFMFDSLITLIEERKHAEQEILKLSFAVEQNPASIVITNINGDIEYVNKKFCDLTGYTKNEVIGQNPRILNSGESSPEAVKALWDTILEGKEWKGEFHNKKKNGDLYWEFASISAIKNQAGEIINFLAIKEDITERKQSDETLQNERALFRTIIDLIPNAVYVKDVSGRKIIANPKEVQLAGKTSEEEIIGKTDADLYPSELAESSYAEDMSVIGNGKPMLNIEGTLTDFEGKTHSLLVSKVPLFDVQGKITGLVGVTHDITERKNAEEEVRRSAGLIRSLFDSIPDIIFFKDVNGVYLGGNPAFAEFSGRSTEQISGLTDYDLFSKEIADSFIVQDKQLLDSRIPIQNDLWITYPDGRKILVDTLKTPYLDPKGELIGVLGISRNITERKHAEEALQAAHKSLSDILNAAIHTSIISTDTNGIINVFSKGAEIMLGYSASEIIGKKTPEIIHLENEVLERSVELSKAFGRKIEGFDVFVENAKIRGHEERTWTYKHRDGKKIQVSLVVTAIRNSADQITGFLGIAHDITARIEAEEALLQSNKKWEAIISSSPDGIGMVSFDGKLLFASDKLAAMHGYLLHEKAEFIGKSIYNFIDPSIHHLLTDDFRNLISSKNEKHRIAEYLAIKRDNSRFFIDINPTVLYDATGNPSNILFIERDITERKQAEAELEENREKYRGLSEASFEAIFISENGVCIEQNQAAELMFGYTSEEAMMRNGTDWIIPEDRERALKNITDNIEEPYEAIALRKDGSTFPCVLRGRTMHYKGRKVRVTSLTDISLLKRAEQELIQAKEKAEESERKFMSIIQSQAEGIGFVNQDEVFEFANTASERIFETDELIGTCLYDYLKPEEKGKVVYQTRNRGDGYVNSYDLQIVTKKGTAKYIHVTATPKLDSNNKYIGAYGVFQDITERVKAEEEVKRASTRLSLATLAGGVGVWEFDIARNFLLADDQVFKLFGLQKQENSNALKAWESSIYPDDKERIFSDIELAIRGKKDFNTEFQICWSDGSNHNIRAMATVQNDDSGKPMQMIGTIWDITEQKKTEAVLLKARYDAEMANKSKSIFLANMSHEIRTPLNAIIGFSQLMNRDQHLTDTQKEYIFSIIRAGEHLLSLINDILELSKMEAGRLEINPTNVDLYALFDDIKMIFKEPAQSKHLQFILETAADLPQYVLVDDNKLRRILINLIGNAIKFTDEGGVAVRARADKVDIHKSRLVVEIQDSGPGIAANELSRLFQHFVQTTTGMKKSSGSGLGLALSRELAMLMGGDISVISEEEKGSVFTFYIEIGIGNAEAVQSLVSKRVVGIDNPARDFRILVVDDKKENLQVVVNLLELVGFKTKEATNGEDAIVKFEEWDPHLILMDMRMPVMDGYEATKRIKSTEKGKRTAIVALTASSFNDERRKSISLGMQGHIRKPFRESELFGTIGSILGIKYIYEDEIPYGKKRYFVEDDSISVNITKLPVRLVEEMKEAAAIADLDLLIELIGKIDEENSELARHLMALANNYDYDYLQQLLNKKEG